MHNYKKGIMTKDLNMNNGQIVINGCREKCQNQQEAKIGPTMAWNKIRM